MTRVVSMKRSLTDLARKRTAGRQGFADSILSRVTSKAWEEDADIEDPEAAERNSKVRMCFMTPPVYLRRLAQS